MNEQPRILVVEDDRALNALVCTFLGEQGYDTQSVESGTEALARLLNQPPDLVVLDLMLPGMNGLEVCARAREFYKGPIIMLTALGDDMDEVAGLETGADDYLVKPVNPKVLLAHVRAQLRRQPPDPDAQVVVAQNLEVDLARREARLDGMPVELTTAEFDLLALLAQELGKPVSRETLHRKIFHMAPDVFDRSVDLRVSRLRKKLEHDRGNPRLLKTVRNQGYMLCP